MSYSTRLDFHRNVWREPLKRTLVRNFVKGHNVCFENNTWKVNGKKLTVLKKHQLNCLLSILLSLSHHLKSLSSTYRKKYNLAIENLSSAQMMANRKVGKITAIKNAQVQQKQFKDCNAKLEKAERNVQRLESELDILEGDYQSEKEVLMQELSDCTCKQLFLNEYLLARSALFANETKLISKIYISHELKVARGKVRELEKELLQLEDFSGISFVNLDIEQLLNMRLVQDKLVDKKQERLKLLNSQYKEQRKKVESELKQALKDKEDLRVAYKSVWLKMNQSPVRLQKRLQASSILSINKQNNISNLPMPPIAQAQVNLRKSILNVHAEAFFSILEKKANADIALLWQNLLSNFEPIYGPNFITGCTEHSKNTYEVTLERKLRIWISSKDETGVEDPKGGVIFIFGGKNKKIVFSLRDNKMEFKEGFEMFFKTPDWAIKLLKVIPFVRVNTFITAVAQYIHYKNPKEVVIAGKAHGISKPRKKEIGQLLENWGQRAKVVVDSKKYNWDKQNERFIRKQLK